jgi:hypothetical protein
MSLTTDGVWAANVWASTVWADCVWYEAACDVAIGPVKSPLFLVNIGTMMNR